MLHAQDFVLGVIVESQANGHLHFQVVSVVTSIQMHATYIQGKRPCRPKLRVMFKLPWILTQDTTTYEVYDTIPLSIDNVLA